MFNTNSVYIGAQFKSYTQRFIEYKVTNGLGYTFLRQFGTLERENELINHLHTLDLKTGNFYKSNLESKLE